MPGVHWVRPAAWYLYVLGIGASRPLRSRAFVIHPSLLAARLYPPLHARYESVFREVRCDAPVRRVAVNPDASTLLICTLGGSPEPVVASIKYWQPQRVVFVHTPETRTLVDGDTTQPSIVRKANEEGFELDGGRYDFCEVADGQDLASCLERLQELTPQVFRWVERGGDYRVVVDFTGGTKCMSAALALQARRWPCVFSYVGGSARTKGGVGVVVTGSERVVYQANPWDALGFQAVEDFVVLFDQLAFAPAWQLAEQTKKRLHREDRKGSFAALEALARGFEAWDRFDHQSALNHFKTLLKRANDLSAILGTQRAERTLSSIRQVCTHLEALCKTTPPSRHYVVDLIANAKRRAAEGRYDDAVARLYRAVEALAQAALREKHNFAETERIPLDRVPEPLRSRWTPRATQGTVAIGLRDAYELLRELQDPFGERFHKAQLASLTSPLTARNRSILAHGFEQISANAYKALWDAALSLAELSEAELPAFCQIGSG